MYHGLPKTRVIWSFVPPSVQSTLWLNQTQICKSENFIFLASDAIMGAKGLHADHWLRSNEMQFLFEMGAAKQSKFHPLYCNLSLKKLKKRKKEKPHFCSKECRRLEKWRPFHPENLFSVISHSLEATSQNISKSKFGIQNFTDSWFCIILALIIPPASSFSRLVSYTQSPQVDGWHWFP